MAVVNSIRGSCNFDSQGIFPLEEIKASFSFDLSFPLSPVQAFPLQRVTLTIYLAERSLGVILVLPSHSRRPVDSVSKTPKFVKFCFFSHQLSLGLSLCSKWALGSFFTHLPVLSPCSSQSSFLKVLLLTHLLKFFSGFLIAPEI